MDRLDVPLADDFHIHLRQGAMMQLVTQQLKSSGIRLAYVMVLSHHIDKIAQYQTAHYNN